MGVQNHINIMQSQTNLDGQEKKMNIIDCLRSEQSLPTIKDGVSISQFPSKPPINTEKLADWFNLNEHNIKFKNYFNRNQSRNGFMTRTNGSFNSKGF